MKAAFTTAGLILAACLTAAGCMSVGPHKSLSGSAPAASSGATTAAPAAAPSPSASPDGTYEGSCDYDLGDDPASGTATATGEVDLANDGNVGTVVRVKITWPQLGYAPLKMVRTVRVRTGAHKQVRFHMPLTYDQLDRLQNWQTGHDYRDGCTYKGTIVHPFGPVSNG